MKKLNFFIVFCVFIAASGTPQVFYTPFARNRNLSGRQYYAVEYLGNTQQHQPGQDYNLHHGDVDAPAEDDDDTVDENIQNFFYNNGFEEIANDEEVDLPVMHDGGELIQVDVHSTYGYDDDEDDEDTDNLVDEEFEEEDDIENENQSTSAENTNETISSEESSTKTPMTEENADGSQINTTVPSTFVEDSESTTQLETNDNNSSSTTELPDKVIPVFVHPILRPSSEWPLDETEMNNSTTIEDSTSEPDVRKPLNQPRPGGNLVRRQKIPQKNKRIRVIRRGGNTPNRRRVIRRRGNPIRRGNNRRKVMGNRRPIRLPPRNPYQQNPNRILNRNSGSNPIRIINPRATGGGASCQCGVTTTRRILGGQIDTVNEFPWLALITYNHSIHCTGTLINDRHVVSAAHCVRGYESKFLRLRFIEFNAGRSKDSVLKKVSQIYTLKSYNARTFNNDIAILRLKNPINFETITARPICLPPQGMDFTGDTGIIAGWGSNRSGGNSSHILRKSKVPIISNQQCHLVGLNITESMLCAGRLLEGVVDACQGDSGGPLMVVKNKRYFLAGIVSWGDGCAWPKKTGVYARTTNYLPWIKDRTTGSSECSN